MLYTLDSRGQKLNCLFSVNVFSDAYYDDVDDIQGIKLSELSVSTITMDSVFSTFIGRFRNLTQGRYN